MVKEIIENIKGAFADYIIGIEVYKNKVYIEVEKKCLRPLVKLIKTNKQIHYVTSVGVDERPLIGGFGVYHIFTSIEEDYSIIIHTSTPQSHLTIPSIVPVTPGANWAEREIQDLLGLRFAGHPDPRKLILPDDWPPDIYPLRKDTPYNIRPPSKPTPYPFKRPKETSTLPIGPYHPLLHEPEYFELYVKGEEVVDVEYRGFHVHRGIEKLGESKLTYNQIPFIAERICGICGFTHSTCYCQAVEEAVGIDVPERARYIRSILLELERIHSHLLWIGVACHLLGFDTGFMHAWRIREPVMQLCEMLTGNRKTYGANLVGGVRWDIKEKGIKKTLNVLNKIEDEFKRFIEDLMSIREVKLRLTNTGVLTKQDALKMEVVGPVLRASGVKYDVRKAHPYAAYKEISLNVPVYSEGDNMARLMVRIDEVFESINIIRELIDKLPKGPIMAEEIEIPSNRKGLSMTEAPRGENLHFIITGRDGFIYRWRVRAPTYANIPALKIMLKGCPLSDTPITIASIDPCFSCTDRVKVIDIKTKKTITVPLIRLTRGKIW